MLQLVSGSVRNCVGTYSICLAVMFACSYCDGVAMMCIHLSVLQFHNFVVEFNIDCEVF